MPNKFKEGDEVAYVRDSTLKYGRVTSFGRQAGVAATVIYCVEGRAVDGYPSRNMVKENELIGIDQVAAVALIGKVDWTALAGRWDTLMVRMESRFTQLMDHFQNQIPS